MGTKRRQFSAADALVSRVSMSWLFRDDSITRETVWAALRSHPNLEVSDGEVIWRKRDRSVASSAL